MSREWLETNGLGGFSSSTIIGLNTRRYHGLLTAAMKPPVGRMVLLSKLEETLVIDDSRYELSANQYPGALYPSGFQYQTAFRLDPFPVFAYEIDEIKIEKSVFMVQGENTVVVQYEFGMPEKRVALLRFEVRPLIGFRDYHSTTHENDSLNPRVEAKAGITTIQPYTDLPALHFAHDAGELDSTGYWYRNFEYVREQERGLDFVEDLFSPFLLRFDLNRSAPLRIIASTEWHDVRDADRYLDVEKSRRQALASTTESKPKGRAAGSARGGSLIESLIRAADQFIVSRGADKTVVAGYPWFSDWGRDTMIALPGLTLATGRPDIAKSILVEFAKHVDQGMLPNRFPDGGEAPEYNTVDATLWFFEAVRALLQNTNDHEFVRESFYDVLTDIIAWHVKGTRYNIHVDTDGLLSAGESGVQLTWMDAKLGDWVVTPRPGKPVEIQALWYNALCIMEQLAEKFGDQAARKKYKAMAKRTRDSFNRQFWNKHEGCLYDVIDVDTQDSSIRPNQVIAISLSNSMVSKPRAKSVLRVIEGELLTPRGLRTLAPKESGYVGSYEGDPSRRDAAYHQGTVWPWLMGPFITAYSKTFGEGEERGGSSAEAPANAIWSANAGPLRSELPRTL